MANYHPPMFMQPIPAILSVAGLLAMGIAVMPFERTVRHYGRRVYDPRAAGSIAAGNRHGGQHEHRREIARRERQAARAA